ncbi:PhnD/SsuA/transferrin family substrate-binding protein [Geoalkalibacter sp.]|uniref:PhnD/SsuA/transferrin family substrate-binding protein n=1 Tax=Geoalkalibacter sp. TaxID=3041440 RepID=UPI00272E8BD3|nr:PhnD/SsuA/transferrin family substrate-binding protein [Geoalkalibacter sp.]
MPRKLCRFLALGGAVILPIFLLLSPTLSWGLTYAPIPMANAEKVIADTKPLLDYLSRVLGQEIRIQFLASNEEVVRGFAEDRVDLAEIGPLPYLVLREVAPQARALLFFLEEGVVATYTCALVAPFDGAASVAELGGRDPLSLATTQRLSTCGPLAARWLLEQGGLDPERAGLEILGNHEAVALAVARAEFAAGTLKTLIARRYQHLGVRALAETPPLPVFALVANTQTLSETTLSALERALRDAPLEERARWILGRHGFAPVTADAYAPLEDMLRQLGLTARDFLNP